MRSKPALLLGAGGAVVPIAFEHPASPPFRALRRLRRNGRSYHQSLTSEILDPFLQRWSAVGGDERGLLGPVTERAMDQCLAAFDELRRAHESEEAVFAALTVTANLQRTLTGLAERLARDAETAEPEAVLLSRTWCGFAPGRSQPVASARWRALGCSPLDIEPQCRQALRALRSDLRREEVLAPEDWSGYANRSGAVRLRKSSI